MSQLHKIFKEMKKLTKDERDILVELLRESDNVERTCQNLGVKYTDEILESWLNNTAHYRVGVKAASPTYPSNSNNSTDPTIEQMKKIIKGDNLDIIEEAAKDRGLI